jgi:hypothetical protein
MEGIRVMKNMGHKKTTAIGLGLSAAAVLSIMALTTRADEVKYRQVNLVSDLPNVATLQDTNLVNAWGVSFGPTTPFWVSDNGKGLATLYAVTNDSSGTASVVKQGLEVKIPGDGTPTGQAFNTVGGFNGDLFLFVSEDGTISGWRSTLGTTAETLVPGSPTNVYKGMTLAMTSNGPVLLAANFMQRTVDVYDTNSALIGQFMDPSAPSDYAPFGIQAISNLVFVTFAKQDSAQHDDVAGVGHGLIDVFDPNTGLFHRFATGSDARGKGPGAHARGRGSNFDDTVNEMNSPWGIALAPGTFDKRGAELLVGNFGSGTIMRFDSNGKFRGLLQAQHGPAIVIDGLWALTFGNGTHAGVPGTLYFSAGPNGEADGLFGSLEPVQHGHGDGGQGDGDHGDGGHGNNNNGGN